MFHFLKTSQESDAEEYALLLKLLNQTKESLYLAYEHFENATDPELIDSYIYEVNAMQMRYKFLLTRVKSFEYIKIE